jgi:hypothetical protein
LAVRLRFRGPAPARLIVVSFALAIAVGAITPTLAWRSTLNAARVRPPLERSAKEYCLLIDRERAELRTRHLEEESTCALGVHLPGLRSVHGRHSIDVSAAHQRALAAPVGQPTPVNVL